MRIHFPQAPSGCNVILSMYTKRPNRLELSVVTGEVVPITPADATLQNGKLNWQTPDKSYVPTASNDPGTNYHERKEQLFHMVIGGGEIYEINTIETIILELRRRFYRTHPLLYHKFENMIAHFVAQ